MNHGAQQLTQTLDSLSGALAVLAEAPLADLLAEVDPATAEAGLLTCVRVGRQVAGITAHLSRRVDAGGSWAEQGHRSVSEWLTARTTVSRGQAQDLTRIGDWARAHPVMSASVVGGLVDHAHVKVVADAHRHYPRLSQALHGIEAELADYAATTDPVTFASFLNDQLHRIDPDAVDDADAERFRREAFLTANTLPDGYVRVHGMLPPEVGAALRAALDSATRIPDPDEVTGAGNDTRPVCDPAPDAWAWLADPLPDAMPPDSAFSAAAQPTPEPPDVMPAGTGPQDAQPTRRQRNITGLGRILAAAAAAAGDQRLPDVRGARPVVHVQVHPDTVDQWLTRARHAVGESNARCAASNCGPGARLIGNPAPITANAAKRICCDAEIRRIVIDPDGAVLDVGRLTRVISPALRVAVTTRDQHCRFPGCRAPIDDIHHVQHWIDGGRTDRANCAGLCWFHHHEIHHGHWIVTGDANHELRFTRNSVLGGLTWTSRPPRC